MKEDLLPIGNFESGPFNDQGWYHSGNGFYHPGKPAAESLKEFEKNNPEWVNSIRDKLKKISEMRND